MNDEAVRACWTCPNCHWETRLTVLDVPVWPGEVIALIGGFIFGLCYEGLTAFV